MIFILFPFLLGILLIIGAITGYIGLITLLLLIIGYIYSKYTSIKYPEMHKYVSHAPPVSIWAKLFAAWVIIFISAILVTVFLLN